MPTSTSGGRLVDRLDLDQRRHRTRRRRRRAPASPRPHRPPSCASAPPRASAASPRMTAVQVDDRLRRWIRAARCRRRRARTSCVTTVLAKMFIGGLRKGAIASRARRAPRCRAIVAHASRSPGARRGAAPAPYNRSDANDRAASSRRRADSTVRAAARRRCSAAAPSPAFLRTLLAEGGAAGARRDARVRRPVHGATSCSRWPRATTSSRAWSCATATPLDARARSVSPRRACKALPARGWTLLVQGVNLHSAPADALLRRFSFLPYARLDDLMVSYAAPGGGVGPHFDSYDVFLLQGFGAPPLALRAPGRPRAAARTAAQDPARASRPTHDAVLAPGDMLYLPPHYAHDGVALDACTTYSIGFRAASDDRAGDGVPRFPARRSSTCPAATPTRTWRRRARRRASTPRCAGRCATMLAGIRWDADSVARFLGCWLSEPKPDVFFDPPARRAHPPGVRRRAPAPRRALGHAHATALR